ncbi:MAG TPA: DUF1302 family protein [Solimonas sp.]|nr:DUF1302 family protein [Solimonas sp.]
MRSKHGSGSRFTARRTVWSMALALAGVQGTAGAGSLDLGNGIDAKYNLILGYAAAVRTEGPASALVNGPIDPATGLPSTANADDGDRNFDSGSLINNRASILGEFLVSRGNYGAVLRGDAFYDQVYRGDNDNDSPGTINKSGANDEFTDEARRYNGGRARVLDAYLWGDWALGNSANLNLRAGRQVVAWGESLFFSGVAAAQGPADATKANVPGVEVKNILLPINQVAAQLDLGSKLSLMGYYKLQYKPTELEPAGAYFSTFDGIGPGAEFLYGFANPLAFPPAGPVPGAPPTVNIARGRDIEPSDHGQYGLGAKYELTGATTVGLYWLRYHNTNPQVQLNFGFATLHPGVPGVMDPITTAPNFAPVSYQLRYFDGIDMAALSFSTRAGPVNVAGEVSYRDGLDMLVNGPAGPTASRGKLSQALVSAIWTMPPNFLSQQIDWVGEAGYIHVEDVDAVGGSEQLTNDKKAYGYSLIATLNYRNVLQGWDLAVPVTWAHLPEGRPAMAGAFGSLYGEDDRRASIGTRFTYLQKLEVGLSYNAFLGSPDLQDRPYADRDYAALNLKYSF